MAVLRPLRVVIDNYPEGQVEQNWRRSTIPKTPRAARAKCRFRACSTSSRTISAKIRPSSISACRRAAKCACATATSSPAPACVKDENGEVTEIHCTYDPATRGGNAPDGRKVKSTIHWVSAAHAVDAEVRIYETLFTKWKSQRDRGGRDFTDNLNPNRSKSSPAANWSRVWPTRRPASAISSSAWAISVDPDPDF
jgi:glutaminyl-tRNA synthetase